jgi:hypothetical protein
VWAQNRGITNPHLVRPGHKLELLLGSEDQAPAFRFSEEGDAGLELAAATSSSGNSSVEIPPPEVAPRPVIRIPHSFPLWQEVYRRVPDEMAIDDSRLKVQTTPLANKIILNGFAQDQELAPYGAFLETEKESGLPVPMQYVYVKLKKGLGHVGQKMLIVKDHGKLPKLNEQVEGKVTTHFIEVFGDLQIIEPAQAAFKKRRDRENYEAFRALILHATNLTLTNFDLIPGEVEYVDLSSNGPSSSVTAQILGSTKHKASALYGPGDIIFLNRGRNQGLGVGQIMDLRTDRTIRDRKTEVEFSNTSAGTVKIVRTDANCATAVVLASVDGLLQGDQVQQKVSRASGGGEDLDLIDGDSGVDELELAPENPEEPVGDDFDLSE